MNAAAIQCIQFEPLWLLINTVLSLLASLWLCLIKQRLLRHPSPRQPRHGLAPRSCYRTTAPRRSAPPFGFCTASSGQLAINAFPTSTIQGCACLQRLYNPIRIFFRDHDLSQISCRAGAARRISAEPAFSAWPGTSRSGLFGMKLSPPAFCIISNHSTILSSFQNERCC